MNKEDFNKKRLLHKLHEQLEIKLENNNLIQPIDSNFEHY
jgi:hypothetical protein